MLDRTHRRLWTAIIAACLVGLPPAVAAARPVARPPTPQAADLGSKAIVQTIRELGDLRRPGWWHGANRGVMSRKLLHLCGATEAAITEACRQLDAQYGDDSTPDETM